ncbi:MAG TPA: SDR family NAD(P)-dependent oxidoreductase [Anaerolineaceae bacterium]|nr:SDR family NAD(P)-dependent oxidoreductase [Anaerolineaceae bacterium]
MQKLKGKIAVVTGASRGAGRGIALVLGEAGATVYVTGRSVRESSSRPELPGTSIDETAEMVTARGGVGIPVRCDHTVDDEVESLFSKVEAEQGKLDILVNNVWGGYEKDPQGLYPGPFWEQPMWRWDAMFVAGVRAHYSASRLAARLMIPNKSGLIINTTFYDRGKYFQPLSYFLAKNTINQMAYGMGLELREHNIAAIALSPGWMRTEAVMAALSPDGDPYPDEYEKTESVEYIGRAVLALASDSLVINKTGQTWTVGDLAIEYDFSDIDGRQVPTFQFPPEYLMD